VVEEPQEVLVSEVGEPVLEVKGSIEDEFVEQPLSQVVDYSNVDSAEKEYEVNLVDDLTIEPELEQPGLKLEESMLMSQPVELAQAQDQGLVQAPEELVLETEPLEDVTVEVGEQLVLELTGEVEESLTEQPLTKDVDYSTIEAADKEYLPRSAEDLTFEADIEFQSLKIEDEFLITKPAEFEEETKAEPETVLSEVEQTHLQTTEGPEEPVTVVKEPQEVLVSETLEPVLEAKESIEDEFVDKPFAQVVDYSTVDAAEREYEVDLVDDLTVEPELELPGLKLEESVLMSQPVELAQRQGQGLVQAPEELTL